MAQNREILSTNTLEIKNLWVEYRTDVGVARAVNGLNLTLGKGESLGLVGESGSGKTTTALSVFRLLPRPAGHMKAEGVVLEGRELTRLSDREMRKLRGNRMAMVFQNPLTSLNPVFTVGEQIAMVFRRHKNMTNKEAMERAGDMLELVNIPRSRLPEYPHQFSGGMRQRVGIAAGLACEPGLLIADEPTTALDVTIQLQIIELIKEMEGKFSTSLLMITHNLGIIVELCKRVAVVYAGSIVEHGTVEEIFSHPVHPYTIGLLGALPKTTGDRERLTVIPGNVANANNLPSGCPFHPRCTNCMEKCKNTMPPEFKLSDNHFVSCYLFGKEAAGGRE